MRKKAFSNEIAISEHFTKNKDIVAMTAPLDGMEWPSVYDKGFKEMVTGNWTQARSLFTQVLDQNPNDTPTQRLLDFMQESDFKAPENWKGYKMSRAE